MTINVGSKTAPVSQYQPGKSTRPAKNGQSRVNCNHRVFMRLKRRQAWVAAAVRHMARACVSFNSFIRLMLQCLTADCAVRFNTMRSDGDHSVAYAKSRNCLGIC
jgi:hypothetical protein